jgi:hypothetical protein
VAPAFAVFIDFCAQLNILHGTLERTRVVCVRSLVACARLAVVFALFSAQLNILHGTMERTFHVFHFFVDRSCICSRHVGAYLSLKNVTVLYTRLFAPRWSVPFT